MFENMFFTPPMLQISFFEEKLHLRTEKAYVRGLAGGAFSIRRAKQHFYTTMLISILR